MRRNALIVIVAALVMSAVPAPARSSAPPPVAQGCAGKQKAAAPIGTFATSPCPGVRPGALVEVPSQGVFCTLNFLFSDSAGVLYIGTAGHCAFPEGFTGERKWLPGRGPVVTDSAGKPFGRFVYAGLRGDIDFGLIQISRGIRASAQMCHFGGPTAATSTVPARSQIEWYGNALGIGDALPARTSLATGSDRIFVYGAGPTGPGDSGGGVLSGGKAAGIITEFGAGFNLGAPWVAEMFVRKLGPQLAQASKILAKRFTLRTAKRL